MTFTPPPVHRYADCIITPYHDTSCGHRLAQTVAPASGTWSVSNLGVFYPLSLRESFTVAKAFVINGATTGTDSWDLGVYRMTDLSTGRLDLIRSTGAVLSAGTASAAAEASVWKVAAANITTGTDSTDATSYTTASVTLKEGRLYLLSIVNTATSADAVSSITGGPTWTSRSTTQYNGTAHRVSIWSGVPSVDYTGTIAISFGANTETGCRWSLNEFSGVDTATTDGIVQQAVGTGNSVTPLATLAAFGSSANATFGALANTADSTTTPGTNFRELSDDATATTPASFLQTEWYEGNDTTVDGTITSGQWGVCAVEIKADTSPFIIPPSRPGDPDIYMAMAMSGTTATVFRGLPSMDKTRSAGMLEKTTSFPLPSSLTPVAVSAANRAVPLAGFSSRTLLA